MFQLTFAIITAALLVGALVERMRFSAMLIFVGLWSLLVYAPVAHWVWEPGGWLAQMGALDFAGGSVVHVNAGVAGLVCAWFLGRRTGYGREPFEPYNLGLTMAGAGMLWVGWFGFNAGSAVAADGRAGLAMAVTHLAAAAGALSWMLGEWVVRGRPSLLGLCSGLVAGLVAITPAAGFVTLRSAVVIGLVAGLACYWGATGLKRLLRADDSLDVFGVHGIGGIVGSLLTGVLANETVGGVQGSLFTQAIGVGAVMAYSLVVTAALLWIINFAMGLRVDVQSEQTGLDIAQHRECALPASCPGRQRARIGRVGSAIISVGELVLPLVMVGMAPGGASTTRRPGCRLARLQDAAHSVGASGIHHAQAVSSTAIGSPSRPILVVPTGWKMVVAMSPASRARSSSVWYCVPGFHSWGWYRPAPIAQRCGA
jgi:ammonium transporter